MLAALVLTVWSSTEAESGEPSLEYVGNYDTRGDARSVTISGNYAYVAEGYTGLEILNIEDPANPTFVGWYGYGSPNDSHNAIISGNYAYVADGVKGLTIVNIEDSTNLTLAGKYQDDTVYAKDVTISGNYAYVASSNQLVIVNIEDPTNPTLAGRYSDSTFIGNTSTSITISGNYAYVTVETSGGINSEERGRMNILNIEDPTNLTFVGSYVSTEPELGPGFGGYAKAVTVSGDYAYVSFMNESEGCNMTYPPVCLSKFVILNIEDPSNPTFVGSYEFVGPDYAERISISGNYAYCSCRWLGVVIVNIEDPTNPTFAGSYDTDGYANELFISGNYVYVTVVGSYSEEEGLVILRITLSDTGEDEEGIPSISLIISLISIGLLAIFRRK